MSLALELRKQRRDFDSHRQMTAVRRKRLQERIDTLSVELQHQSRPILAAQAESPAAGHPNRSMMDWLFGGGPQTEQAPPVDTHTPPETDDGIF